MSIRVLLADDHTMVRDALCKVLEDEPDIEVVGTAANGRDAIELARELAPDVVVLDVAMPDLNGIETAARIRARDSAVRIIGISTHTDKRFVTEMFKAGARAYIAKASAATELIRAIRAVAAGRRYLCPRSANEIAETPVPAPNHPGLRAPLSRREREVLQLVAEGLRTAEIALRMHVAESTVEVHRRNISQKLGLHSIAELTKFAIREGLTTL